MTTAAEDKRYRNNDSAHFVLSEDEAHKILYGRSLSVSKSTPSLKERRMRIFELGLQTRDETVQIGTYRRVQRDEVLKDMLSSREAEGLEYAKCKADREQRWSARLEKSPFRQDLPKETATCLERAKRLEASERRARSVQERVQRDGLNLIFRRAVAEEDKANELRKEKRELLEQQKKLKALKEYERTQIRAIHAINQKLQKLHEH